MLTLYKRGKVFWCCSTLNGQRRRWSLRTQDREVAIRLKRKHELDLLSGGALVDATWKDFEKEFTRWIEPRVQASTLRGYGFVLRPFTAFLDLQGIGGLAQITPSVISEFTASRRAKKREGGTKFDLRVLRRVFSYAVECGYLKRNPVIAGNLNSAPGRTQPFSPAEIAALLTASADRPDLYAIVRTFLHTGLRISDVATLRRDAIHSNVIILQTRKRRTMVRLPMHPDLSAALREHFKTAPPSPLAFPGSHGKPLSLAHRFRRLWKAAKVANGHAHRFRSTFAVELLRNGASLYDVAKLLGISAYTAERHYSPFCQTLQDRAAALVSSLNYASQ